MKQTVLLLLVVVSTLRAEVALTPNERQVVDSLIATYSAMVPMALLPKDWPPDVEELLARFAGATPSDNLRFITLSIVNRVDQTWFGSLLYRLDDEIVTTLPNSYAEHNLPTEIAYRKLGSGYVYVRWQQNRSEPIAHQQLESVLKENSEARCLILDLERFDITDIDSILAALSHFLDDTTISVKSRKREIGTDRDMETTHKIPIAYDPVWTGALLVYIWDNGWPGRLVGEVLSKRPYTTVKFEHSAACYVRAVEYEKIVLPHGYEVLVPIVAAFNSDGDPIGDEKMGAWARCGLDAVHLHWPRQESFYQGCKTAAKPVFEKYRREKTTYYKRLAWLIQDLRDSFITHEETELIVVK